MFPLEKCCYVLQLKTGIIIIGIIEIIALLVFGGLGIAAAEGKVLAIIISLIIPLIHLIGCILLLVSTCTLKKAFARCYLITSIIRMVLILISSVILFISSEIIVGVINIFFVFLGIYFWICVYSWYIELRELEN